MEDYVTATLCIYYINFLFSPVAVSLYFSSTVYCKAVFVNFCTNERIRMCRSCSSVAY